MDKARDGALGVIRELRSTHGNFSDREVGDEDLGLILDAATRAGSASCQQSYSIIVLEDRATMKELTGYSGSRALVFCADGTRLGDAARRLGHQTPEEPGTEAFVTWSIDAILAAQTACIAARSLGIDSLFTNGIGRTGLDKAYRLLALPEKRCYPLITLILGYADAPAPASEKRGRYLGPGLVHYGRYSRLDGAGLDRMIAEHDDPVKRIGMHYGYEAEGFGHYLDWLFVKWLGGFPRGNADATADRLERSGFIAK